MKISFSSYGFLICFVLMVMHLTTGCKKKKMEKKLHGVWIMTSSYTESHDYLEDSFSGTFFGNGCDTIAFERIYKNAITYTFLQDGTAKREEKVQIRFLDSAASMQACAPVYGDSIFDRVLNGTWELSSEHLLDIHLDSLYEINKLVSFSAQEMNWQTDLNISAGILNFQGIKYSTLVKK